jgi:DNA-binding NarL/FixJ family response regulator
MSNLIELLVVDDHILFRRGLIGLLGEQPDLRIVGEAGNGQDAIELGKQRQPDVILMDVHMPGMDGIKAVKELKKGTDARILMLTISDKDEDLLNALAAGADGYLLKNTELDQLCQAIRQVHAGQGVLSPEITAQVMKAAALSQNRYVVSNLSQRECEVLVELAQGATTSEIATNLVISKNTVKTHIGRILKKLDVANRAEAVARASTLGLIPPVDQE